MSEKEISEIFGTNEENGEFARGFLSGAKDAGKELIHGESLKTEKEIEITEAAISFVKSYLHEVLKIDCPEIDLKQIHFFEQNIYDRKFVSDDKNSASGNAIIVGEYVCIRRTPNEFQLLSVVIHEILHILAAKKLYYDVDNEKVEDRKTGYRIVNPESEAHTHFEAFNEIVTEYINFEIISQDAEEIAKMFDYESVKDVYMQMANPGYPIEFLSSIIERIAEKSETPRKEIKEKILDGYFSGTMMHLRLVDRYLGRGVLRFLGFFNYQKNIRNKPAVYKKIWRFLKTDNQKERDLIAYELLGEREYLRYKQQAEKN